MMGRLADMVLQISPRERRLLGFLVLVLFPVLLWLWLISPLQERRAAVTGQLRDMQALQIWVADRAADQLQLGQTQGGEPIAPIGISGLEQSLLAAQLRSQVTRLGGQEDGGIELGFETVDFTALASWLSQMDPGWGYDIATLRLQRHADPGGVSADLTLVPQSTP